MKKLILSVAALALLASPLAACDGGDHAKGWDKEGKAWSKAAVKTDKKASASKSKAKSKAVAETQAKEKKI